MKSWMVRACGVAGMAFLFAGCNSMATGTGAAPELDGTAWVLDTLPDRALVEHATATLQFAAGRASGSDGCNRFGGGFTAAAGKLSFAQLAGTQMACMEPVMTQAGAVNAALAATRSYRMTDSRLELLDATGKAVAVYKAQDTGLPGTRWTATGINNGKGAVASLVAGTEVSLEFGADGRASGTAGCNRYTAGYTRDRDAVTFTAPAATRMACGAPGVMEQEQAFLAALTTVATARMEGDRLELRTAGGALAVALRRAAANP